METHILFFILAGLLIAILIGYSLWTARREKSRIFSNTFTNRPVSAPVGSSSQASVENPTPFNSNAEGFQSQSVHTAETPEEWQTQQQDIENQVQEIVIKLPNQPEPQANEPTIFNAQPEPAIAVQTELTPEPEQESEPAAEATFITLYVVAPQGQQFYGASVVQQLEALGLQYGEHQIFHRHIDHANSPVLFSAANMIHPGVFDLNNIEHFTTIGLVFFMQLPSPNNDLANLRMMISTVESFAQSLGGFVLDEQQQIFDENARQNYLQRVRQH